MQFEIFTDAVTDLETECLILAIAPEENSARPR